MQKWAVAASKRKRTILLRSKWPRKSSFVGPNCIIITGYLQNRFTLISLRDWTDGQLEEGEKHGFDKWVPIVKILLPAQGQMDESDDQQQATTSQSNSEIQANQFPPVSFLSSGASSSLLPSSLATNTLSEFSLRTPDDTFLVPHGDSASFSW